MVNYRLISLRWQNNVEPEKWLHYVTEHIRTGRLTRYAICYLGKLIWPFVNINTVLASHLPTRSWLNVVRTDNPSPLPTGRWNYVLHVTWWFLRTTTGEEKSDPHYRHDNQILALYARGMTTHEITSVSKKCTMQTSLRRWYRKSPMRNRPGGWMAKPSSGCDLSHCYLDCIVLKVRQDSRVINKAVSWLWVLTLMVRKSC